MQSTSTAPVRLGPHPSPAGRLLTALLADLPTTVDAALDAAPALGAVAPSPGTGDTADLWESLATVAAADLGAARALEPHLDALAILDQATMPDAAADPARTWGVFAAEGGSDPLQAAQTPQGWALTGTKPWCSLAGSLSHALVSAHLADGRRGLFAVGLGTPGVAPAPGEWVARGLTEIPSTPLRFDTVAAHPVGDPGWYLSRPGFAWGGIGVAACWYGGAVGVARTVFAAAHDDQPFALMHLGAIDELLGSARRALAEAARLVDAGAATGGTGSLLAKRVRATVARAAEEILERAGHALGPAPLALDAEHAKRVADLQLYLRQHHAERDQHALGRAVLATGGAPW